MPSLLLIESSGDVCSAAISKGNSIVAEKSIQEINSHSTYLASFVNDVLEQSGQEVKDLDAIVLGGGPGSYTGLRIGCSLAKGLCFGADLPLITCSTLKALAAGAMAKEPNLERIITLIDARRMDAYLGVFDSNLDAIIEEQFITIDSQLAVDYVIGKTGVAGSGVQKWVEGFGVKNIVKFSNSGVYAKHLLAEALLKWEDKDFADMVYYEPNYIKSVFVTKPKPKF
ncbi:MAG: tRNA (adenosine(37)-N6)-threonylcarbamoyltransferase complex dimerization subunit type 1 TsaB [Bacteroidetes bacterium]|nr:MAG: tRNA (adenosine(37)-N6)-threonylcarbamoyltransferase complex dimerization subunit type 1 TsaB [Bacteroidota bacterium]